MSQDVIMKRFASLLYVSQYLRLSQTTTCHMSLVLTCLSFIFEAHIGVQMVIKAMERSVNLVVLVLGNFKGIIAKGDPNMYVSW